MMNEDISSISRHFSGADRVADYTDTTQPMNEARRDLVRRTVLGQVRPGIRILEIGCGIGTLTAELAAAGMACTAIDLSAEMIARAKALVGAAAEIEQADLFEFRPGRKFAAVVANGVACYYRDKPRFLRHIAELTEPNGLAAIVHRNTLFNLFALNQGTIDFVADELLKDLPEPARKRVAGELNAISGLAVPRLRDKSADLYRSAENPLDIADLYAEAGFSVSEIRYCFMHGAPPRLPSIDGIPATAELQRRYEDRWEGMFLGSQFLVVARRR
jgi:SAM-dependent methyltransferase